MYIASVFLNSAALVYHLIAFASSRLFPFPNDLVFQERKRLSYNFFLPASRHHEESSCFSRQQEEPDLSGLYYQRTIVRPNAGNWSIQFISGP
jgi:hypothetical protein